jgi:cell division septation protein DedD
MDKIKFLKVKPLTISLVILLSVLIVFVTFQLGGLRKPQKILPHLETIKEEILPVAETKLQAEEKPILAPPMRAGGGVTIQVASFQDKARAEIVVNDLKQKGYQPVISSKELPDKGTWYRVFVGDFATEEETKSLLDKLKESYKDSFIKLK